MTVSDNTRAAIKKAQANGHLAFINTGRTTGEIDKVITDIGFDGYVCGCGTYISYQGSVLHQTIISPADTRELIRDLRHWHLEAILEGPTDIYYDNHINNKVIRQIKDEQAAECLNTKSWDDPDVKIAKFCIWPSSEEDYNKFYEKYKDQYDFIRRGRSFSEVIPKGSSKATGIRFILDHLNISQENTYALGDSTNDLSMLKCVKHSIAMGNSCREILSEVSFVTDDVDKDGVANALKYYNII
jgi:Cof subfamily protein (haloacid dehalogenase superfamily)